MRLKSEGSSVGLLHGDAFQERNWKVAKELDPGKSSLKGETSSEWIDRVPIDEWKSDIAGGWATRY